MIYLDHAATTKPYPEVIQAMKEVLDHYYGNPSSLHQFGVTAERLLQQSRERAALFLGVEAQEIVFTSGATESNNLAIKGAAWRYQNRGKHIITSAIEHPAVFDVCQQLEQEGYRLTVVPVGTNGKVKVEDVEAAIQADTVLVSIMHVNNEVGSIQPIAEIGQVIRRYPKVLFHVDAVQGFAKVAVEPVRWGVDLLSISAHKFHGPKGTGLLYIRKGIELTPLMVGGGQERGFRSGTENLPGIVGMVKAMRLSQEKMQVDGGALRQMRDRLWEGLEQIEGCILNSPREGVPHIINFSIPPIKPEIVLHALEEQGILVSTKSACSSKADEPSRTIVAMGCTKEQAASSIRVSLSYLSTQSEIEQFLLKLKEVIPQLQQLLQTRGS
jgi:cysteine desulfurase